MTTQTKTALVDPTADHTFTLDAILQDVGAAFDTLDELKFAGITIDCALYNLTEKVWDLAQYACAHQLSGHVCATAALKDTQEVYKELRLLRLNSVTL